MDKRNEALLRRKQLTQQEIITKSHLITEKCMPYLKGIIALYMPMEHEVDVSILVTSNKDQFCVPKVYPNYQLKFFMIDSHSKFKKSRYGIIEPIDGKVIDKQNIDVMLIPVVAFDANKNRLGHGAGYYDRYLETYKGKKIGVAFECQKVDNIVAKPHDIALDIVICEDTIYE